MADAGSNSRGSVPRRLILGLAVVLAMPLMVAMATGSPFGGGAGQQAADGPNAAWIKAQGAPKTRGVMTRAACGYGGYGGYGCPPGTTNPPCGPGDSALIDNGTIRLGVCRLGELNVPNTGQFSSGDLCGGGGYGGYGGYGGGTPGSLGCGATSTVGLRYLRTLAEATARGCPCEGWGAGDATSGDSGWSNQYNGTNGLTPVSFAHDGASATSVVRVGERLEVTQEYHPSDATSALYEVSVSIKNISAAPVEPRYRRVMDWDIEPTAFREYVTINGGSSSNLLFRSNDGFGTANPLGTRSALGVTGDVVDSGPKDHGALFDFGFDALAPGATKTFSIFYGAAGTEAAALDAVQAADAEVYSLGQPSTQGGKDPGVPATFVFAFRGVGGTPIRQQLELTPTTADKTLGQSHRVTAALRAANGAPLSGKTLRWSIVGPNAGTGSAVTDADGRVAIEWTGTAKGTDELTVYADLDGDGTRDDDEPRSYASADWSEVDPVGPPTAVAPVPPGGGTVTLGRYVDAASGLAYITVPAGTAASFPDGCMPLTVKVDINPGAGTLSNVKLSLRRPGGSARVFSMTQGSGNSWSAEIDCVATGTLVVEYDLTEGGATEHFEVPIGGLVLIDPSGIVYDKAIYDAQRAQGKSDAQAKAAAAIPGAKVTLERKSGSTFSKVLSGDPGIAPNVNPETTGADGRYAWDVSPGTYRVVVQAPGYASVTSTAVTVPPPVLDLDIALVKPGVPGGGGTPGGGAPGATPSGGSPSPGGAGPAGPGTPVGGACDGKTGTALASCRLAAELKLCARQKGTKRAVCEATARGVARCPAAGSRRATCLKRARALARCRAYRGKRRAACEAKARRIGTKKRTSGTR
jgi:hypothetical protein